jgi:hypothetical protein
VSPSPSTVVSISKIRSGSGTSAGSQARRRPVVCDRDPAGTDRAIIGGTDPQVGGAHQPVRACSQLKDLGRPAIQVLQQDQVWFELAQQFSLA